MEKKQNESFRQYAQRWREVAMQVQPPLLEKETTMLFINTLKAPFITHMIGSTTKSFVDIVIAGEMIENAIRVGKIEAWETTKKSAPRRKDNEMNNTSTYNKRYSKAITVSQPKVITAGQRGSTKQEFGARFIKIEIVKFDDTPSVDNPLPNHGDKRINTIGRNVIRKINEDIAEVKTPLRMVWREMVRRGLILSDSEKGCKEIRDYCEFHKVKGHEIQEPVEFKVLVQSLMGNKELEFYEEDLEGGNIHATEGELTKQKVNYPRIIISRPRNMEGGTQLVPKVVIPRPVSFPYKDNKMVPWNYDCNVPIPGVESSVDVSKEIQNEGSYTLQREKGPEALINEPVKEEEAKEFLKFLKHREYSVVEQLRKQPARISMLALLLSSEVYRESLMKVLNETYVTKDISLNKLDRLVSNISADNFIYFSDDEIPPGGMGSTKALHITTCCKGYTLPSVLIDNGSALNVLPLPTLKRLLIDKGRLVTINTEEDIIVTVTNEAPYLEANEEATECSFRSLEFINATFILEGNEVPVARISRTTRMGLQMMMGRGALPGNGLGRHLQGGIQVLVLKEKRDHFGLGFRPDARQRRKKIENKQERRRARLNREEVKWESMTFPHISQTFVSGGIIHPERGLLENPHINAIHGEETEQRNLLGIRPYKPGSVLDNWTIEELLLSSNSFVLCTFFGAHHRSLDINDMSNDTTILEVHFEQDMCLEESQDFEGDRYCDLSPDLLIVVKQEEKQILPHGEEVENIALEEGKVVKIGTHITEETKQDLVELLREFKDVFAWSYQDIPGLSTDIEVVKYSAWVANIVPVPMKDGNIKKHLEDMEKTTFITLWGTFCYKVMPFGLKNAGATYQRAMVTLFHDMMHKEIEVYVDDMIAKSRTEKEHTEVLSKLFLRLRKFELKLNPAKCTFGAQSGKLLGFVVSERGIKVDSNKGVWDNECQEAFDTVKQYLSNAPVLSSSNPDKPLILYLSVFNNSMGCVLGQHDESGRKEKAIYYLIHAISYYLVILKLDPLNYMMDSTTLNGRMERWQILLFEFDIVYVNQKAIKGSAIAEFLASRALEDYEPLSFDFPNEELMYVATTEECPWKLNFDGASNAVGNGIGAILLKGEWEKRDPKLSDYQKIVLELIEEFDEITFNYLPRDENQMADALATLASMIKERDDHPWYHDVLRYVKSREYSEHATENDKRKLKRLASDYVLDGGILYKRRKDQVLLRCIDAIEARKILEEVHEGVCGTHANGFTMARQIMRFGYYWSTMEGDCINYAKRCHKCQIYGDKIHVPLHLCTL
ncbi:hypothetical protein EPI10_013371 [Gossypium australe]|uniref:G-patch domain-containing protein n=1 Tax=Gossypium australe TaxID=47621 RepID=A0A5B6UL92_9ROSI|nr:hypothetical protein EPI10_013371 [Gossypium australe]